MIFLLILLSSFIEPGAMQPTVQPGNNIILALNQMSNAIFRCVCDECGTPPHWSLENGGRHLSTGDNNDRVILAQRGITYSSNGTSAMISIPDTVENNNTRISCGVFISGSTEFSNQVEVTIIGPPLPPDPVLVIISSSQLEIQWEIPYSHPDYPVVSYHIQIVNESSRSGDVLDSLLEYNETSYVYTFEEDVQYCQILTVNAMAVSDVGPSEPGAVSRGFPIALQPFQSDARVEVTLQENGTPMARVSFMPPFICDYQIANYTLTIEDITDPKSALIMRRSFYSGRVSGGSGYIVEIITSGLQINHNYTLFVSVVDNDFNEEVSTALYFTSLFQPGLGATDISSSDNLQQLGISIGVPVAVVLFLLSLVAAISVVLILIFSIAVRTNKELRESASQRPVSADTEMITEEQKAAPYEQEHIYETINDYTVDSQDNVNSSHDIDMKNDLHGHGAAAIKFPTTHPQLLKIAQPSQIQEQPQSHQSVTIKSSTNNSNYTIQHSHSGSSVEGCQFLHTERDQYKEVSQYEKTPYFDIDQIATLEAALEDKGSIKKRMDRPNTRSHDVQQEANTGQYDKICRYERVSHYEKAPHCDLTSCMLKETSMKKLVDMRKLDPHCDIDHVATLRKAASEDKGSIEQRMNIPNTHSGTRDLQKEGNSGYYDEICWYERVSHYEKAPYCDLTLRKMGESDEQWPPP